VRHSLDFSTGARIVSFKMCVQEDIARSDEAVNEKYLIPPSNNTVNYLVTVMTFTALNGCHCVGINVIIVTNLRCSVYVRDV
jgi:hypothetical protein